MKQKRYMDILVCIHLLLCPVLSIISVRAYAEAHSSAAVVTLIQCAGSQSLDLFIILRRIPYSPLLPFPLFPTCHIYQIYLSVFLCAYLSSFHASVNGWFVLGEFTKYNLFFSINIYEFVASQQHNTIPPIQCQSLLYTICFFFFVLFFSFDSI